MLAHDPAGRTDLVIILTACLQQNDVGQVLAWICACGGFFRFPGAAVMAASVLARALVMGPFAVWKPSTVQIQCPDSRGRSALDEEGMLTEDAVPPS